MSSNLDNYTVGTLDGLVMDEKKKMIYDSNRMSMFQHIKYKSFFSMLRPDLSREDSYEWNNNFTSAEKVMKALMLNLSRNLGVFQTRMGNRYTEYTDDLRLQLLKFYGTPFQENIGTRVGSFKEVQSKINFYTKIMDKVKGYEMLYPIGESTFEPQAQRQSLPVKERQDALKEKFLREMGVDYSILK